MTPRHIIRNSLENGFCVGASLGNTELDKNRFQHCRLPGAFIVRVRTSSLPEGEGLQHFLAVVIGKFLPRISTTMAAMQLEESWLRFASSGSTAMRWSWGSLRPLSTPRR